MKLIKFLVIASVLTARTCQPEIVIPIPSPDESTSYLVKDLVKIVTSCYGDRLHTVGLAGSLPDALSRTLSTKHSIPVVLVDDLRNYTDYTFRVPQKFQHKVHVFIIGASTSQQLDVIIQMNIKLSIWWNHMASFLIVDRSPGCVNFGKFLGTAWYRNVLNAKVLCYGSESARIIYNYNPFTDQAPVPWQRYAIMQERNNHPFTLFYRKYRENESLCINLDFDKTKDLGGYEIRVVKPNSTKFAEQTVYKRVVAYFFVQEKIVSTVCRALNGTTKFSITSWYRNLANNDDIGITVRPVFYRDRNLKAYPHTVLGSIVVSQFRHNKSQLKEILRVIDVDVRIGIAVVCLATFIFLKFFVHQAIMTAFLNIIRVTCKTRFTNIPDNTASRIFISCLLLFSFLIQGIVQCKLGVRLTTKTPVQNVNTMEDIETFGYKLCAPFNDADFRDSELNKGNLIKRKSKDCYRYVNNDASIAYWNSAVLTDREEEQELKLHVSRQYIYTYHMSFPIRFNWPLEQTVNRIIAKLVEADALEPWNHKSPTMKFCDLKNQPELEYTEGYKPLNFDKLKLAFIILGIGLASAIVSFIFEIVIGYKCTCKITSEPRQFRSTVLTDRINHCYNIL